MNGFSTVEALFGTKYGSVNTQFKTGNDKDYTSVPEGIAHFLEHKLFENEDTDVFELYAKTGASANAYTTFDKTCYLFGCSDNYKESLEILLTFVRQPYFTQESVAKEQGIIGQEIQMCLDNPAWVVFFNVLKALYHNHPVNIDIAGTAGSIAQITPELLYKCYETFYSPRNMALCIAGNIKAEEVLKIADKCLEPSEDITLETHFPDEPETVAIGEITANLPVGTPLFNIAIKSKPVNGYARLKAELECGVALDVIAGPSSPLYKQMTQERLINTSFATEVFCGDGYFSFIFSGESDRPKKVMAMLTDEIERVKVEGIDEVRYENVKKANYGYCLRDWGNVEAVASNLINSYFDGVSPFDPLTVLTEMTFEDVQRAVSERFDTSKTCISIVEQTVA
jgi:predicted Zn-dependent peptidase